jgi:aspartate-semialdehyde dehydrogenase
MAVREVARIARRAHIALFDANTLVAKGVKEQLVARAFPSASVRLFTSRTDPESNLTEFAGEAMLVTAPSIESLENLDIAFLCGTRREGALYLDWPRRAGFTAIDLTLASNRRADVPLVNVAVNPEAIVAGVGLIATPHPVAQILSTLLAPVRKGCGLQTATAVVFQPASECGEEGIEELYQQTVGLLNFRDIPRNVFGRQLAFNLIPASLYQQESAPCGAGTPDLESEVLKVTGGDYALSIEVVLAPVFHCHAVMAHLTLPRGAGRGDLLACFERSEGVRIGEAGEGATPAERAGEAGTILAGIRPAAAGAAFWVWAVTDNLKSGTALNAVRIAEGLLDQGLGRSEA